MGDAAHNLRTALDHWATSVVTQIAGNKEDRSIYFPFSGEGKKLEDAADYIAIHNIAPDIAEFISKDIKPCFDTDRRLWRVIELDNIDKHEFKLPSVFIGLVDIVDDRPSGNLSGMNQCRFAGNAARSFVLWSSSAPITIRANYEATLDINFPKEGLFAGQPVIPTLRNLIKIVTQTLNDLERFLQNRP